MAKILDQIGNSVPVVVLLFSLIRHESLFDTYATAAAGEKGLTQVIPPTGSVIFETTYASTTTRPWSIPMPQVKS